MAVGGEKASTGETTQPDAVKRTADKAALENFMID